MGIYNNSNLNFVFVFDDACGSHRGFILIATFINALGKKEKHLHFANDTLR